MTIPDYITEQIERRMGGRFRLRWSDVEQAYLYEQKVRRGLAEGFAPLTFKSARHHKQAYEDQVRARDGYVLVMKIFPGTRTSCPSCHGELEVPAFRMAHIRCPRCAKKNLTSVVMGGFFPLSDSLLEELERGDPDRGGTERVLAAAAKRQQQAEKEQEYAITAPAEAAFRERFRRLAGIPEVGVSSTRWMPGTSLR